MDTEQMQGYALILGSLLSLIYGVYWLERQATRRAQLRKQVQVVRDRLTQSTTAPRWRTTVQANDGSQFSFTSHIKMHAGEFIDAHADGTLTRGDLLTSNRIAGVVVSCTEQ